MNIIIFFLNIFLIKKIPIKKIAKQIIEFKFSDNGKKKFKKSAAKLIIINPKINIKKLSDKKIELSSLFILDFDSAIKPKLKYK